MLTCAECGTPNPEGSKFCNECAAPLAVGAAGVVEERKVVSVLFCDLVGFTAASDAADPEDVRAMIRPYHTLLKTQIETYGGTVEKFIGDAVMAVFGAPVAHEDDPERAIRAGLRILEAIAAEDGAGTGTKLRVRIGINTGEAVVSVGARPERGESLVTGDVVNTASRLQGVAPVDGIAVGQATYEATASVFDFEELDPVELKGKAEPVPLWWAKAARARFGTDVTRVHTTPLVGRELERDLLTATFERAVRDRSVHLVTVVGEPGIGKSRLVAELFHYTDRSPTLVSWRQGRCLPYGEGVTFWALGEIVKAAAGILESDPPAVAAEKIDAAVPDDHPDAAWLRQRLRPLLGMDAPAAERDENFAAWRRFLELLGEHAPVVLVFEDLHWADEALLAFLEHVVEFSSDVPMVVLVTTRPELFERAPGFAQAARNSNRVNLAPLSEAETARLATALLDATVLPAEVSSLVVERSGGNPLYAEEFVRLLKDTEVLRRIGGSWTVSPDLGEIPLPSGVHGLIAARLDTLEPDRKRVLQDAAVLGKVFWTGGLAAVGGRDPADVEAVLHELGRHELVRRHPTSSMQDQVEYAFWHALVRDVCYGQIPRAQRIAGHVAAAAWIESAAGLRLEDHAEILAGHYTTALALSEASGREPRAAGLAAGARKYLLLAAERAKNLDVAAAESNIRRALELTPADDPERAETILRLAEIRSQRTHYTEAVELYDEAHEAFLATGDVRSAAVALALSSMPLGRLGDPRNRERSDQALELLEPLPAGPELVAVLAEKSGSDYVAGRIDSAIAAADRSLEVAEQLGMPPSARALGFRGGARAMSDPAGIEDLIAAMAAADTQGLGREGAVIRHNLANIVGAVDGPETALAHWLDTVEFSRRRGIEEFVTSGLVGAIEASLALGRWDDAWERGTAVTALLEASSDVSGLLTARHCILEIATARGVDHELERSLDWLVSASRDFGEPQLIFCAFPSAAWAELRLGRPANARDLLEELAAVPEDRNDPNYAMWLATTVRTAIAADDPELAARLCEGLHPALPLYEHALVTAKAAIAEVHDDLESAAAGYADAATRWRSFGMPWEAAQAELGSARTLAAMGRAEAAGVARAAAREAFASLDAMPWVAEVDAIAGEATAVG